jgi:lambda family phage portal protein
MAVRRISERGRMSADQIEARQRARDAARAVIRAKFDAAQTTDQNTRHWANADALSADAAASYGVRTTLRNRARYEVANNCYARGIVNTIAHDMLGGPGPSPQFTAETLSRGDQQMVEREFAAHAAAMGLASKARTMRMAQAQDGEAFGILITNPGLRSRVKLGLRLVEPEMVTSQSVITSQVFGDPQEVDGIRFDPWGNTLLYRVLRSHPGGVWQFQVGESDDVPAEAVIHLFRAERPDQRRGLPEIMAALPLFALLRRWTLATVKAAEVAASFSALLFTDQGPDGEADEAEAWDTLDIEHDAMTTLPMGWKLAQLQAEHPSSTYEAGKREVINEIARCLDMPYNVAAGNSSSYNYASGRLDWQTYFRRLQVDRYEYGARLYGPVFDAWAREAALDEAYLPMRVRTVLRQRAYSVAWNWPGMEHVDPEKEANAALTRIAAGISTQRMELAKLGLDYDLVQKQREEEARDNETRGIAGPAKPLNRSATISQSTSKTIEEDEEDQDNQAPDDAREPAAEAMP